MTVGGVTTDPDGTVRSAQGMVCTSQPLAADAGIEMLEAGGSAADAAVAAAAVLNVVNPHSTGIGGDAFALWWGPGDAEPAALAGAGPAPAGLSVEALRGAGYDEMPNTGPWAITVPGAVSLWTELLDAHGRLEPTRVLAPAIDLARGGFALPGGVARYFAQDGDRLSLQARACFMPAGRAPEGGETVTNPELGDSLATIAEHGAGAFYHGEIARRIGDAVERAGGPLRAEDLAGFGGATWVRPLRTKYRGVDLYELPPPGQGLAALEALALYAGLDRDDDAGAEHALLECMKLAFADAYAYVADPDMTPVPVDPLLDPGYLQRRRGLVDPTRARPASAGTPSDTVYVAVADADGGACSFIQSLYEGFGSGIVASGTGILLQNRGANFTLDETHPNRPAPGKRPYHTIIPAMLGRDGAFAGCLGVVGGFMQPQGQVQIMRNLLDRGLTPQAALDAPRWRLRDGLRVDLEDGFPPEVEEGLALRGHEIGRLAPKDAGGAQLILRDGDGYTGASERRQEGCALGR
ncbi:MAG: gamma-glutamyltranspeptidase / glutathione hydrolase [Solirubrobacteraceae bacterium]|nr:gamma-glutamyltranspeptidase / glutathione hydrolase [Solirubrobacteraceae bacterium]